MAYAAQAPDTRRPASNSRLWWHVHHWAGLKFSLFMSFILLTGTLATVSHEIDWLITPSLRVSLSTVEGLTNWPAIAEHAARHPGVDRINYISEPTARAFAARVAFQRADDSRGYLHAHPSTGRIQGETGFVDAQRIFRNLHRHLNLPTKYGVPLVSLLSLPLLVSLVTAFVIYKKWWRGFFRPVRWRNARTAWGDVHRLVGLWSLWFVALIALTSLWYLVESLGGDAPQPPQAQIAFDASPVQISAARLAFSLRAVSAADPALEIETVQFPGENSGAFVFGGQKAAWLVRPRANEVSTEAASGRVLLTTDALDLSVHQRISEMADPLHFGTFGGYWTKIPWFLFGLALTMLSVSGAAIYALRIGRETEMSRSSLTRIWLGMGQGRWLSATCVIVGLVMIATLIVATP